MTDRASTDRASTDRASTGRPSTAHERAIRELLTAGDFPGSDAAQAQIRFARHGGHWTPGDPSFDILIDGACPRIEPRRHPPEQRSSGPRRRRLRQRRGHA
jgi:hypothetical protein